MNEQKAREILNGDIEENDDLHNVSWYISWRHNSSHATLDGEFDADDLEAIAWWIRNKYAKSLPSQKDLP